MDSDDEDFMMLMLSASAAAIYVEKKVLNKQRNRRLWAEQWLLRRHEGKGILYMLENELKIEDPLSYKHFLRMCELHFEELLYTVKDQISRTNTNMREAVSPSHRLAITLRFLATGDTYRSLMFATRVHESTISLIVPEVCCALFQHLNKTYLKMPNSEAEWKRIAKEFQDMWDFPFCIRALDGKHVPFDRRGAQGPITIIIRARIHSIVLLALADAKYQFIYVDVGVNGRISDGGVYRESSLRQAIDLDVLGFPQDECLPGQNTAVPYEFVADDAFPLSRRIIKPYCNRGMTNERRICNYRISRARRVVENSFGILSNRFRILLNTINLSAQKVEDITLACIVLHNYLCCKIHAAYTDVSKNSKLSSLTKYQSGNKCAKSPLNNRDLYCQCFNSIGAVPWQDSCLQL